MCTKYKEGNYSILKLRDETITNIKGEVLFSMIFFLVKLCVFKFKQCVQKKKKKNLAQENCPKNYEFQRNQLAKKKKKSQEHKKMSQYFLNTFILTMVGPDMIFYNFILE